MNSSAASAPWSRASWAWRWKARRFQQARQPVGLSQAAQAGQFTALPPAIGDGANQPDDTAVGVPDAAQLEQAAEILPLAVPNPQLQAPAAAVLAALGQQGLCGRDVVRVEQAGQGL